MKGKVQVITIDGPSGVGKGSLSRRLAEHFHWHFLDSGALYRVLALAAEHHAVELTNEEALVVLAGHLDVQFAVDAQQQPQIILEGERVTERVRLESCAARASTLAALPRVREALLHRQRAFRQLPGLVADGRDMGTVVFPEADVKIFLTASAEVRALRRQRQLQEQGQDASLADLITSISARDLRDQTRAVAPLVPAENAWILDTTNLDIEQVFAQVLAMAEQSCAKP